MNWLPKIFTPLILVQLWLATSAPLAWPHITPLPQNNAISRQELSAAVKDFVLSTQDDKKLRFSTLRGKIVLATFVFTTCPDVCPLFTAKFAVIQRALQEKKQNDYALLSITTDPERDTPAALKDYARQFKADLRYWSFLTGPPEDLSRVWKTFGVNVRKLAGGQIQHTGLITLIDRQGIRRVNYWGDKVSEAVILKDLFDLNAKGKK